MNAETMRKYESFKCRVLGNATGATVHKLNTKLCGVCIAIDLYRAAGEEKYKKILEKSFHEISQLCGIEGHIENYEVKK